MDTQSGFDGAVRLEWLESATRVS